MAERCLFFIGGIIALCAGFVSIPTLFGTGGSLSFVCYGVVAECIYGNSFS